MPGERDAENLRVALMSYDDRELRIRKFYLEEQSTIIRCTCFQSGEPVLQALRQERCFDVLAQLEGLRGEIDAQSSTKLTVDCGGLEQCLVWGDREMAEQICFHLLSNALRAAAPGGNIQVCLRQTGQDIRLTIEDDGCGLPEGESWLENRRRFLGGAQAGLLLCRRYCRQLGWALALLPRTPQGVRAELTLPLPTRPFPIETTVEFRSQPSHSDEHSTTALQHQLRRELYLFTRRHSGN